MRNERAAKVPVSPKQGSRKRRCETVPLPVTNATQPNKLPFSGYHYFKGSEIRAGRKFWSSYSLKGYKTT